MRRVLLAVALSLALCGRAFGNTGVFAGSGHSLRLVKSADVQMVSEDVTITPICGASAIEHSVEFHCLFVLKNRSTKPTQIQVGFPLVLQHHFGIGDFRVLRHTGGMVDRAGQFGVTWKSAGGLDHGYDRTARSGGRLQKLHGRFAPCFGRRECSGAFLGVSSGTASGRRSQEYRADGFGFRRAVGGATGDRAAHRFGLAAVSHGFPLGGSGRAARNPGGV